MNGNFLLRVGFFLIVAALTAAAAFLTKPLWFTEFPDAPVYTDEQLAERDLASPASSKDYPTRSIVQKHNRPIKEENGRTLLWAGKNKQASETDWFDMTDALVDPKDFQFGLGKDQIPSIDNPVFAKLDDTVLEEYGIGDKTDIIGFVYKGLARAYPLFILDRAEVVNDTFDGAPFAVLW